MATLRSGKINVGFWTPKCIILSNFMKMYLRNPLVSVVQIIKFVVAGLINALVFSSVANYEENTITAIQDFRGLYFNLFSTIGMMGISSAVYGVTPLIPKFLRDHEKRLYSPSTFY